MATVSAVHACILFDEYTDAAFEHGKNTQRLAVGKRCFIKQQIGNCFLRTSVRNSAEGDPFLVPVACSSFALWIEIEERLRSCVSRMR